MSVLWYVIVVGLLFKWYTLYVTVAVYFLWVSVEHSDKVTNFHQVPYLMVS
jgi:hypothetical protein